MLSLFNNYWLPSSFSLKTFYWGIKQGHQDEHFKKVQSSKLIVHTKQSKYSGLGVFISIFEQFDILPSAFYLTDFQTMFLGGTKVEHWLKMG